MYASDDLDALYRNAVDAAKPSRDREAAFLSELEGAIRMTRDQAEWDRLMIPPGRLAREADAFQKAVAKVMKRTEGLSEVTRMLVFRGLPTAVAPVDLPTFQGE